MNAWYSNVRLWRAMVAIEVRLRLRRAGTLVVVLGLMVLSWLVIPDPAGGSTLIAVGGARLLYNSACLALGSALMASLLFGLAGFYLLRGRMDEDLRSGAGAVLAATPVGNASFLFGRWLGGVVYLGALALVFLGTVLVLHLLRGEGALALGVYVQTYALVLLPCIVFAASMALLFGAWAPLMGKGGDLLYFILWAVQLGGPAAAHGAGATSPAMLIDFSGIGMAVFGFANAMHTSDVSIGASDFNAALAPLALAPGFWSAPMAAMRLLCALVAMLPLLPAALLFHRFAPDRVRGGGARRHWDLVGAVNRRLRPLAVVTGPLFGLAARTPGLAGQVLAELALTLAANPLAIAGLALALLAACLAPHAALGAVLLATIAGWGMLVSEVSVRDVQCGIDGMRAAAGAEAYPRQLLAACLLGWLGTAPVALRWAGTEGVRAAALVTGVFALAAAASLLGRCSGGARAFLALFLFGLYISTQAGAVPALDVVGFNGAATAASVLAQLAGGLLLCALGLGYSRWRAR